MLDVSDIIIGGQLNMKGCDKEEAGWVRITKNA